MLTLNSDNEAGSRLQSNHFVVYFMTVRRNSKIRASIKLMAARGTKKFSLYVITTKQSCILFSVHPAMRLSTSCRYFTLKDNEE